MIITVLSATTETVPTAKGSYQKLELAFKGDDGQVKGKKIMSFGAAAKAFQVLSKAQSGESYEITAVKNEGTGYWDWTGAAKTTEGKSNTISEVGAAKAVQNVTKSTYETAEERAKKQVYIVRQSSISAAIAFLEMVKDDNEDISEANVIATAKQFEAYVFDTGTPAVASKVSDFVGDENEVL